MLRRSAAKSSGHGESPMPSPSRLPLRNAIEAACLATSTGGRTGSLSTNGVKRSVEVTAARWVTSTIVVPRASQRRNTSSCIRIRVKASSASLPLAAGSTK